MKNNITYFRAVVVVMVLALIGACTYPPSISKNPNQPSDVPMSTLLPTAQMKMAYSYGGDGVRFSGVFTQHFGGVDRQHQTIDFYSFKQEDTNNAWGFGFWLALKNWNIIISKAAASDDMIFSGIAKVQSAQLLGIMTDLWGDMPWSEALLATPEGGFDNTKPTYDTQESIYAAIFALCDDAIADLKNTGSANPNAPGGEDAIYGGDPQKWIAAAYAIKARHYITLSQRTADFATNALAMYDSAMANGFTDMLFANFPSSVTFDKDNPAFMFEAYRFDIRAGAHFVNLMKDNNDPRIGFFVNPDGNGEFTGAVAGNGDPAASDLWLTYYATWDSPVRLFGTPELHLIAAEAEVWKGNTAAARNHLEAAIRADMTMVGVEDSLIEVYVAAQAVLSGIQAADMTRVIEEKYVSNAWSTQTYTDYRRTHIPDITTVAGKTFPLRWPYPQSENIANSANVPSVNQGIPVWWDN